ncbi:MAG: hypothetical protein OHK0021_18500 [Bryobacter sp.]|nr:YvcK family protein [Bryobacter sp.]
MQRSPAAREAASPLRIVAIGGGTGLSTLLHGLKSYARQRLVDITAIVTVTDDGGSSGRLRRDFDILPPGDIRNCMVALSEDESLLSRLFQYRFDAGRGLKGHSFGNLFLTALTHVTGDFANAVQVSSEVLAVYGKIFPSTSANVGLRARLQDGSWVEGETKISRVRQRIASLELVPKRVKPLKATLEAIAEADLITFGPGSLYTSIVPNVLVPGVTSAIRKSPARKAYFVNLMWQPWETMHYSAFDHVDALLRHAGRPRKPQGLLDAVVYNTTPLASTQIRRYAAQLVQQVEIDLPQLAQLGLQVHARPLLAVGEKVRHDPEAIARVAMELAAEARRQQ